VLESIKVLQLAKHYFPDTGGIETVTRSISEMLPAHGISADVLCTAVGDDYPPLDLPYRVIRCRPSIKFGRNKSLSLDYVRQVRALQADYDVALIHLPNPVAVAAALAFWTKPIIQLWHADIPQRAIRVLSTPFDRTLARRSAATIGPTPVHLEASHHAAALRSTGVVIGYPFDRTRLPPPTGRSEVAQRVRGFLRGRKLALSIGRLVPYKGFDVLIDAAHQFNSKVAAVIVGDGPLKDELQARIRAHGMEDRVMLTGSIGDDALSDLLDLAHMGCMPSVTAGEMYGVAQVEAMAFGKPVVSTRLPRSGVSFVNKHDVTGLVVEPRDREALAGALNRLAEDEPLHRRLARGAAASFAADHDIGRISQVYAELIRGVVAERVGPRTGARSLVASPPLGAA
jgi:glycosyltransferase involved in cell wall biosynthesis